MPENPRLRHWLERSWYAGRRRPWLAPLAFVFGMVTALRRLAYKHGLFRSVHPGVPVVVVGNLTVGGTGKTPLVIWLAQQLQKDGVQVGVMLRGHGGRATGPLLVDAHSDPREVGDEAVLIARRTGCRVAIARYRSAAAGLLVSSGCELLLSDDGLQHLALQRDLEIVVIDGERGLGNQALLPQGPLRERPARLRRADIVVINGPDATGAAAGAAAALSMSVGAEALCTLVAGEVVSLSTLQGATVHAVAGIGNPARFFAQLRRLGCRPVEHAFPDHHAFGPADLAFGDALPIVMTEKDAVKCRSFATPRMHYLQVSAGFAAPDAARLLQQIDACIKNGVRLNA